MKKRLGIVLSWILLPAVLQAASIRGVVLDEKTGDPLEEGAWVELSVVNENEPYHVPIYAYTEPDGAFLFDDVQAASYELSVSAINNSHLPENYDDVPTWDSANRTLIVLADEDHLVLDPIRLTPRPLYIERATASPRDIYSEGGSGTIEMVVISTHRRPVFMRFWSTITIAQDDESNLHGTTSTFPGTRRPRTYVIQPGSNNIALPLRIPRGRVDHMHVRNIEISGGRSYWRPAMPSYVVWKPFIVRFIEPIVITNIHQAPAFTNRPLVATNWLSMATNVTPVIVRPPPVIRDYGVVSNRIISSSAISLAPPPPLPVTVQSADRIDRARPRHVRVPKRPRRRHVE